MPVRFLCTADVHLGRASSGFEDHTALAAWQKLCQRAVELGVDGLLIAGDLFDSETAQYALRKPVRASLEMLREAGIRVAAVAGNHDWSALAAFHRSRPDLFTLLGPSQWESTEVEGVRIVGRSFTGLSQRQSFLAGFALPPSDLPTVALLHADVDVMTSPYNPVALADLNRSEVKAWVLGHVHAPRIWRSPLAFYPGSPQALDPGEEGIHGARMLVLEGGRARVEDLEPLSTVRYERVPLTLGEGENWEDALRDWIASRRAGAEVFSLRVHLRHQGPPPSLPLGSVLDLDDHKCQFLSSTPELDLEVESREPDAAGHAARLLLGLEGKGDPAWQAAAASLVERTAARTSRERSRLRLDMNKERLARLAAPDPDREVLAVKDALMKVVAEGRQRRS